MNFGTESYLTFSAVILAVMAHRSVLYKSEWRRIFGMDSIGEFLLGFGYAIGAYTCFHAGFIELRFVPIIAFSSTLAGPRVYELFNTAFNSYITKRVQSLTGDINPPASTSVPNENDGRGK